MAGGRIVRTGAGTPPGPVDDLGDVALMPGLVNAHTHVELSWMAGRVPPAASMVEWIRSLIGVRGAGPAGGDEEHVSAMREAVATMRATGTVLAGDISNSLATPSVFRESGVVAVVLHELLGFPGTNADSVVAQAWDRVDRQRAEDPAAETRYSVVAHAPYSTSPALFRSIAALRREGPLSVHVAESPEEVEFLRTGRGAFRALLEDLGVWTDAWSAPGVDPLSYLSQLDYLQPGLLAVHGVYLRREDLVRLADAGGVIVTCPRSNVWVGGGLPPVAHFYAAGVPVAIGTDSLASVASLNMFDELAELRRIAPEVSAAGLLESATRVGAMALGWGREFGTLAAGARAALVAVDVPAGVTDVEEYLVSGVPAASIRMLNGER